MFFLQSLLLGVGLAMDACCVSATNGMNNPKMKIKWFLFITLMFSLFQAIMPMIGYFAGYAFTSFISRFTPWIALVLLSFIGIKMLIDGFKKKDEDSSFKELSIKLIFIQAVATSIDALSVGLVILTYTITEMLLCVLIIAVVTFILTSISIILSKKFGTILNNKAEIIGGIILIIIGLEIFISGVFFK